MGTMIVAFAVFLTVVHLARMFGIVTAYAKYASYRKHGLAAGNGQQYRGGGGKYEFIHAASLDPARRGAQASGWADGVTGDLSGL